MKYICKFFGYELPNRSEAYSYINSRYSDSLWYILIDRPIDHLLYAVQLVGMVLLILRFAGVVDMSIGMCILAIMASSIWNMISSLLVYFVKVSYNRMKNEEIKKKSKNITKYIEDYEPDESDESDELA